jgi:hypothetical protein
VRAPTHALKTSIFFQLLIQTFEASDKLFVHITIVHLIHAWRVAALHSSHPFSSSAHCDRLSVFGADRLFSHPLENHYEIESNKINQEFYYVSTLIGRAFQRNTVKCLFETKKNKVS